MIDTKAQCPVYCPFGGTGLPMTIALLEVGLLPLLLLLPLLPSNAVIHDRVEGAPADEELALSLLAGRRIRQLNSLKKTANSAGLARGGTCTDSGFSTGAAIATAAAAAAAAALFEINSVSSFSLSEQSLLLEGDSTSAEYFCRLLAGLMRSSHPAGGGRAFGSLLCGLGFRGHFEFSSWLFSFVAVAARGLRLGGIFGCRRGEATV